MSSLTGNHILLMLLFWGKIIYIAGDIKEELIALTNKHSQREIKKLPNLIKEIISL